MARGSFIRHKGKMDRLAFHALTKRKPWVGNPGTPSKGTKGTMTRYPMMKANKHTAYGRANRSKLAKVIKRLRRKNSPYLKSL